MDQSQKRYAMQRVRDVLSAKQVELKKRVCCCTKRNNSCSKERCCLPRGCVIKGKFQTHRHG